MKILHTVPTYYPAFKYGGPILSTHLVNKKLVAQGINIQVLTTMDGQPKETIPNKNSEIENVNVYYCSSLLNTGYGISLKFIIELFKNVKKYDLILITSVFTFTSFVTPLICLLLKKPYIFSSRGTLDPINIKNKSSFLKNSILNLYERFFLNKASSIIVLMNDEKNWLTDLNIRNKKVSIIPNGMDIMPEDEIIKDNFTNKHITKLLYLGRLNYKKNIDMIINAYSKLTKINGTIELIIAGPDDGNEKELRNLVHELGLSNKIQFKGLVVGKEKEELFKESDIFILPSISEGISMAQLEAMKYKCSVIVGNRGGIHSELISNHAGIVIEPSIKNLTNSLEDLIKNKKLRKTIAENGFNLVKKNFSWKKIIDDYIKLYNENKR